MLENFGKRNNNETTPGRIEQARSRLDASIGRVKSAVEKKGGWERVKGYLSKGLEKTMDMVHKHVLPATGVMASTLSIAMILSGGPTIPALVYGLVGWQHFTMAEKWNQK